MTRNRANTEGQLAKQEFDLITRQYRHDFGVVVIKCHPKFVPTKWTTTGQITAGFFQEIGPPDRHATLPGGLSCWLDVKTWKAKNRHTNRKRTHQHQTMFDAAVLAGALGFYVVKWRWDGVIDWRLHPVKSLKCIEGGIVFERQEGVAVAQDSQGLPRWYEAILEARRVTSQRANGRRWAVKPSGGLAVEVKGGTP